VIKSILTVSGKFYQVGKEWALGQGKVVEIAELNTDYGYPTWGVFDEYGLALELHQIDEIEHYTDEEVMDATEKGNQKELQPSLPGFEV